MIQDTTWPSRLFTLFNYAFLLFLALSCILPLVHILAISFSSDNAVAAGQVKLWPVQFTTEAYRVVLNKIEFLRSMGVTLQRVVLGVSLNMLLAVLMAYPLSKEARVFPMRTFYAWAVVFTMLFHGGLVPTFMTVRATGILDTVWALVLPGAVPVFNVLLLLNFFRGLPKELEEAAMMDGAGHFTTLFKIYLPLSLPALATIGLFSIVGHWNAWFDGMLYMNSPVNYPLQTYLRTIVIDLDLSSLSGTGDTLKEYDQVSARTVRAAQIFLGALPVLLVYPFLQKYFTKGIVLGSVKE
ncbi:carbohydrate ABC transporter permease [Paenibacillus senegalensis]|uniref:carbohydrate ABC transporter permease n=1 Tax=Paenibacillus senegalensis TaxID=1465766 RepID=UPI0002884AC7|nr:carbohydrate ABC transporter permease [Paenibacillus senegalensis]